MRGGPQADRPGLNTAAATGAGRRVRLAAARYAGRCREGEERTALRERLAPGSPAYLWQSPPGDRRRGAARSRRTRIPWPRRHQWFARRVADRARSPSRQAGSRPPGTPGPRRRVTCCGCPARPAGRRPGTDAAAARGRRRAAAETEASPAWSPRPVPRSGNQARLPAPPPRPDRASSRRPRPPGAGPSSETTRRRSRPGSGPGRQAGPQPAGAPRRRCRRPDRRPPGTHRPASPNRNRGRRPLRTAAPAARSPFPARSRHRAACPARQGPGCGRRRRPGRERRAVGLARNIRPTRRKETHPNSRSPSRQMPRSRREYSASRRITVQIRVRRAPAQNHYWPRRPSIRSRNRSA